MNHLSLHSARRPGFGAAFVAACAALLLSACATTGDAGGDADVAADAATTLRSPASERVIGGIAEMVLTDRAWPSFDEAQANAVERVDDGLPLFVHLRTSRPLGQLAHPADPGGQFAFSEYPHLFLHVGDNESVRILSTCYLTLTPEEAKRRELVVPLAPLTMRPGQIPADCWLAAVASGRPGQRTYEVRLAGFPGKFERWLPVPDLLAVVPARTDFPAGAAAYAAMLKAPPQRSVAAVAAPIAGSMLAPVGDVSPAPESGSTLAPVPSSAGSGLDPMAPGAAASSAAGARPAAPRADASLAERQDGGDTRSRALAFVGGGPPTVRPLPPIAAAASAPPAPVAVRAVEPIAVASLPVTAVSVPDFAGVPMLAPTLTPTLVPATTPLPGSRQEIGGSRIETQLLALSASLLGRRPSEAYFVDPSWSGLTDPRGRVTQQQAYAAAVFRGEACSWQRLRVIRRPNAVTLTDVQPAGDPIEVSCADLP